ncbi:MAG TPA: tRNA dihydrouridine(20/20a) synthase DusA, partial [Coxiellaceae bacterium]|nr:tRNA dihydrouridine(20/20a) synthase DusA [Coxiellaceae bacterium]
MKKISIAPMMAWTDTHYRVLMRLISKRVVLYTEMLTTPAVIHGHREYLLGYDPVEHPLAIQLGGSNPLELAECAKIVTDYGYDEINLNVGCPSDRVQSGLFGACLMLQPTLVAECVAAMRAVTHLPVTVKTRIGVDEQDSYEALHHFITTVADAGCAEFTIHARKAWLKGLSPKENREIPPLCYEYVYQLKKDFPQLQFMLNGGVRTITDMQTQLERVDGVMVGRAAYEHPYSMVAVD